MRRIEAVTISAPLASSASSMTCWFGKRAVPAINREEKLVPAMTSGSAIKGSYNKNSATLKRAHDFDAVPRGKGRCLPLVAPDDVAVDRDRKKPRAGIDTLLRQEFGHGCGSEFRVLTVDPQLHHHAFTPTMA